MYLSQGPDFPSRSSSFRVPLTAVYVLARQQLVACERHFIEFMHTEFLNFYVYIYNCVVQVYNSTQPVKRNVFKSAISLQSLDANNCWTSR